MNDELRAIASNMIVQGNAILASLSPNPMDVQVKELRSQGATQGEVRAYLGISLRQVKKHWN